MRITWYGHAAFLIETAGKRIIMDPYRSPDSGGYEPIDDPADLVIVSHENDRYHSHLGQIRPPFEVLRALEFAGGGREALGLRFHSMRVYETPQKLAEDEVTIVHFVSEGLSVAHLGDLGHPLDDDEIRELQGVSILLAPAGGPPTIALADLARLIDRIDPKVIVPMHYKTPKINLNLQPVEDFFASLGGAVIELRRESAFEISVESLPALRTVVSLAHAR